MPIKRLQQQAQFPRIGTLRKGSPKQNGKLGRDLDHFRFDTQDTHAAKMFHAHYGDTPREINVYLPYTTTDENFPTWMEAWSGGGLQHRCDGETCTIWLDTKTGKYSQEPKPCPGGCKETGRLQVIVPELNRFVYVTVETHSVHDIMRLSQQLQAVEAMRGTLQSIPFVLRREEVDVSTPGQNGKRARRKKWLLSIEVAPEWASLQLTAMNRQALSDPVALLDVTDDTGHDTTPGIDFTMDDVTPMSPDMTYSEGDMLEDSANVTDFMPVDESKFADNPFDDDVTDDDMLEGEMWPVINEMIDKWKTPTDAMKWAETQGVSSADASETWKMVVMDNGGYAPARNKQDVMQDFVSRVMA